jgi:hypothetical protein
VAGVPCGECIVDPCNDDRNNFSQSLIGGYFIKSRVVSVIVNCSFILPFTAISNPSEDKIRLKFWIFVHDRILDEKFMPVSEEMQCKLFCKLRSNR